MLNSDIEYGTSDLQRPDYYTQSLPYNVVCSNILPYFNQSVKDSLCTIDAKVDGFYHVGSVVDSVISSSQIHIPSITELGYGYGNMFDASYNLQCCIEEGSAYPIFDRGTTSNNNPLCVRYSSTNVSKAYWTRSSVSDRYGSYATGDRFGEYYIDIDGSYNFTKDFALNPLSANVVAIIRFGKK